MDSYSFSSSEKTYTDKEFIEKDWRICVHYGYILENYDGIGHNEI